MGYLKERLILVIDSDNKINLFRLLKGNIINYTFNNKGLHHKKNMMVENVLLEYDITIDQKDKIYMVYQDKGFHLVFSIFSTEEGIATIRLTKKPIPEAYYLNIIMDDDRPHIFYYISTSWDKKEYRIYHHYYDGEWRTNIIDEINIEEVLNPLKVVRYEKQMIIAYYNSRGKDEINLKTFNLETGKWDTGVKITENQKNKLYLDFIIINNTLNLAYCQYEEGNLIVKYENHLFANSNLKKIRQKVLSNPGNCQDPILVYYNSRLWVIWIEHEQVISRYSQDYGLTWSPTYLWNESKNKDIIKYKYIKENMGPDNIYYSFGKIMPQVSFLGFGPLENTTELI